MQAQVTVAGGEKLSLSGFLALSRAKLRALSGEQLAELVKTDALELLYLHLCSMRNFNQIKDRYLASRVTPAADREAATSAP